jgi:hypothetical protein
MYYGFQGLILNMHPNFKRWFGPYRIQYYLPNNTILLITIDKFDPNLVLVNINMLKPYMFIEDKTFQPLLFKPNDLVIDKPIQTK